MILGNVHLAVNMFWSEILGLDLPLTGWVISTALNALVTGLIVFRILKAFLVKATSIERTLGSTRGITLHVRNIIFVIIESGMALFAIRLVRILLGYVPYNGVAPNVEGINLVYGIDEMFCVIIRSIHFYSLCFTDNIYLARASHQH